VSERQVVLLGLLAEEPMHAWGLEDKIQQRFMKEWTAIGFSSIYRGLAQLEERGLIDSRLEHTGRAATRKVYSINRHGRNLLADAVLDHLGDVRPIKNPFQLGLAFLVHAPRDQVVQRLQARITEIHRWIEELSSFQEPGSTDQPLPKTLVLDHAMRHLRAEQAFVDDALRLIARAEDAS